MTVDVLAHTRKLFSTERVVAGADKFYAISRYNKEIGVVRDSLEEAERDADRMYSLYKNIDADLIGWGLR